MPKSVDPIPAAAVAFMRDSECGIEVYLSRRPMHFRYYPGAYVFPGGRMDETDLDLRQTAVREVLEEIGIEIDPDSLVPLREIDTSSHAGPVYHMLTFACPVSGEFRTRPNLDEVEDEVWATPDEALRGFELPYQVRAAIYSISRFSRVADVLRKLEFGAINEDYWF